MDALRSSAGSSVLELVTELLRRDGESP